MKKEKKPEKKPEKKVTMAEQPQPMLGVSSLLEQLLTVAKLQLAVSQDTNGKVNLLLVQGKQTLDATQAGLLQGKEALQIAQQTLESSQRIEELLGAEKPPAGLRIKYDKTLKESKT
jgi:hypothetical protein